jgi:hypothetical protein
MRKPAAVLIVLSLAVLALALLPAAGLAAKGGGGSATGGKPSGGGGGKPGGGGGTTGGGSIDLVLLNSTDGVPHFGQRVTFNVSTSATQYPWVTVNCSQNGQNVYHASKGIFPTSLGQTFTLGPTPTWSGGDAECTADLENWDSASKHGGVQKLNSMSFHVYG